MKFNNWTLGLAAIGAVSLASAVRAEEKPTALLTSVASTTLSGYVDTSAEWNPGTGNAHVPNYAFNTPGKADGFNLDVIKVTLEKPLDESEWAAGYKVDLIYGPDANFFGTSAIGGAAATDFAIKQAYVAIRTPVGNGIDWKLGVWDSLIGYESFDAGNNPNFTRSYGYTIEPTTHTGLQGNYRVNDLISVAAGIANTTGPVIGGEAINPANLGGVGQFSIGRANPPKAESYKTYTGSVALTAPQDWGFLAGSTLYAGIINGWGGGATTTGVQDNFYVGGTINTPVTGLKTGFAYDYLGIQGQHYTTGTGTPITIAEQYANAASIYGTYQATEKLSFNGRAEYMWQSAHFNGPGGPTDVGPLSAPGEVLALTATVQYDLWKNVISRLEFRWDHDLVGAVGPGGALPYGGNLVVPTPGLNVGSSAGVTGNRYNSYLLAANLIYKF